MVIHAHSHRIGLALLNQAHIAQEDHPIGAGTKTVALNCTQVLKNTPEKAEIGVTRGISSSLKQVSPICWC